MSKTSKLLEDSDVARWHTNISRGSRLTADVYLRRLDLFCRQNRLTTKELVILGRESRKQLEDLIEGHITMMESESKSPGYVEGVLKGVKSWLVHNEIELKRRVRISDRGTTPTLEDERVPDKEELRALLMYGDERTSAAMCLIAMSGLRLQVLGNSRGSDGLTIRDLPNLRVDEDHVEFTRIPAMVVVRASLSKSRRKYFTFLPREGCERIAAYLNKRLSRGERLASKTPVIAAKPGYKGRGWRSGTNRASQFISTRNVSRIIRDAMRPRFQWRPYVLSAYFDTQLLLAESHGKITHPYRVFFMGHKGDIEARYSINKDRLSETLIEDMRRAFGDSAQYLETTPRTTIDKREMLLAMWREQAKMYGIDPMKIKIEKERELEKNLSLEEEQELLKVEIKKLTMPQQRGDGKPYQSEVVGEEELVPYIEEGWEIIKELSNDRFLIKRPNHASQASNGLERLD